MNNKKAAHDGKITILYQRLSREDGDKTESESIANQRSLLEEYAEKHGFKPYISVVEACDIIEPNRGSLVNTGFWVVWSKLYYSQGLIPRPLISRT